MRFLLFSDVHLDAAFTAAGVRARNRRVALQESLQNIVALALEENVDAVLCGGDLYEHDRVSADTASFIQSVFAELFPKRVYVAPGNHDWYGPQSLYAILDWPDNVHIFDTHQLAPVELSQGLTLWGAAHLTPANTPNFLTGFRVDRSGVNLALFHGSEQTWSLANEGQANHAPFSMDDLVASGLDHAFLGHYHTPNDDDLYTYPGNPEPLSFGEHGERGAVIVDVSSTGNITRTRHRVSVTDLHEVSINLTGVSNNQQLRERIENNLEGLSGIARVTLHGELEPQVDLRIEDSELNTSLDFPPLLRWEDIRVGYDFAVLAEENTVRGEFVRSVQNSAHPDEIRQRILITGLRALDGREDLATF